MVVAVGVSPKPATRSNRLQLPLRCRGRARRETQTLGPKIVLFCAKAGLIADRIKLTAVPISRKVDCIHLPRARQVSTFSLLVDSKRKFGPTDEEVASEAAPAEIRSGECMSAPLAGLLSC